jgi:hypothetical protein
MFVCISLLSFYIKIYKLFILNLLYSLRPKKNVILEILVQIIKEMK